MAERARPNIAFAVGILSCHVSKPEPQHCAAMKRKFHQKKKLTQIFYLSQQAINCSNMPVLIELEVLTILELSEIPFNWEDVQFTGEASNKMHSPIIQRG